MRVKLIFRWRALQISTQYSQQHRWFSQLGGRMSPLTGTRPPSWLMLFSLVVLLHGDMDQFERNKVINAFKKQEIAILVATDVAGKKWFGLLCSVRRGCKVCVRTKWLMRPELIPVSVEVGAFLPPPHPLDGMLVHRRVTPSSKFAGTHCIHLGEERHCECKVSCLRTQRSAPAEARTRIARSGVQRTNH